MPSTCEENLAKRLPYSRTLQRIEATQKLSQLLEHRSLRPLERRDARKLPAEAIPAEVARLEALITNREAAYPDFWRQPLYPPAS
jgi:hypothetical protein